MRGQFHTTQKLGPRRELTPEGFLVCYDVPLARTGDQLYGGSELGPIVPDDRGLVIVERTADAVFSPRTIASGNGKPFVVGHPVKGDPSRPGHDVNPQNWRDVSCGTIVNPRRGEGVLSDFLVGDIVVADSDAIAEITGGTTEISLGYTADYEQISPGRARQHNIVINHAALVDQGRCGPRCAIGDQDMRTRDEQPKKTLKERVTGTIEALVAGLGTNDRKIVDASVEALRRDVGEIGEPGSGASVVINTGGPAPEGARAVVTADAAALADVTTRLGRLETVIARVAPGLEKLIKTRDDADDDDEEDDPDNPGKKRKRARKTTDAITVRDSAHLRPEFDDVLARAEILSPGATPPAFDAKAQEVATLDSVCTFRRAVLTRAWGTTDGRAVIEPVLGKVAAIGSALEGMKCPEVRMLFNSASELARAANNSANAGGRTTTTDAVPKKRLTAADINEMHRKEYGQPSRG